MTIFAITLWKDSAVYCSMRNPETHGMVIQNKKSN